MSTEQKRIDLDSLLSIILDCKDTKSKPLTTKFTHKRLYFNYFKERLVHFNGTVVIYAKDKIHAETCDFILSNEKMLKKFSKTKDGNAVRELPLKRTGTEKRREDRLFMFFPFFYDVKLQKLILPTEEEISGIYNEQLKSFNDKFLFCLLERYESQDMIGILPQSDNGEYLRWRWGYKSCKKGIESNTLFCKKTKSGYTVYQYDLGDEFIAPKSMWITDKYDASSKI